jgi:hypothetical protein
MKIRPVGAKLFYLEGQRDEHVCVHSSEIRNCANRTKKFCWALNSFHEFRGIASCQEGWEMKVDWGDGQTERE